MLIFLTGGGEIALECDFQEKPKGALPHFSLLLPVAVELPHYYAWVFLVIGAPTDSFGAA